MSQRRKKLLDRLIAEQNQEMKRGQVQRNQWTKTGMARYSAERSEAQAKISDENAKYDARSKSRLP